MARPSSSSKDSKDIKTSVKKPTSQQELEKAAYYQWLNRGCPIGDPMTDWKKAEKDLGKK